MSTRYYHNVRAMLYGMSLVCAATAGTFVFSVANANTNAEALDQCDYRDAASNDGWGYNYATGESCQPLNASQDPVSQHCSYDDADQNQGWGYDETTGRSCPPLSDDSTSGNPNDLSGTRLVIQFRGNGTAQPTTFDTTGDGIPDTTAPCFEAPIFNPATGEQIGTGADCLDVISNDDGNIRLTGYGFFTLNNGDTIVVRGNTTVRPVLQPTSRDGIDYTHITGANGDDGVLYGTGAFHSASGGVRLSGQVDMSSLEEQSQIFFDCIFVIAFN